MNSARHSQILLLIGQLEDIKSQLETIRDEEQAYYDGLSEKAQEGEKGDASSSAVDSLETGLGELETAISSFQEVSVE